MKCGIANCAVSENNNFLWSCSGACKRHFHAACVGVQRNCEELIRAFMLPLCIECQPQATAQLDLQKLALQQQKMTENITHLMECSHKIITHSISLNATHETLDGIEAKLNELTHGQQRIIEINKCSTTKILERTQTFTDTVVLDQNKAAETATEVAAAAVELIKNTTTETLQHIPVLIESLKVDMADTHEILKSEVKLCFEELTCSINSSPSHHTESTIHVIHPPLIDELSAINKPAKYNKSTENSIVITELTTATPPLTPQSTSGWRFIGTKKLWKADWSEYDKKMQRRAAQERLQQKAIKRRRRARRNVHRTPRTENNKANNNKSPPAAIPLPCDRHLLQAAKTYFSVPPAPDTENYVPGAPPCPAAVQNIIAACQMETAKGNKFINFEKGETINPYRVEKPALLDPMQPPIVRLTQQSASGDGRFLKARLRDPKIMHTVRIYLAFLHDQTSTVCMNGMTKISATTMLAAEGLPTATERLMAIFLDVNEELGTSRKDALDDLQAYREFLSSERIGRLQQLREASAKFHRPLHFRTN